MKSITVDRHKSARNQYTYEITVPKTNGLNGTSITLTEPEAMGLHACLASALGLSPGPEALAAEPCVT